MSNSPNPRVRAIADAIAGAEFSDIPFPHIVVHDVLPTDLFAQILQNWPDDFNRDPGEIDRYNYMLQGHDGVRPDDPNWSDFADTYGFQIVESSLNYFLEYNETRFGPDATYSAQIQLVDCGPDFSVHPAHSHHNHGPGWAMTFLLFLDDGGRTDRGEVLSAPRKDADWLDVVAQNALQAVPMKKVPFEPNTLLAWMDGPMSFHGTATLPTDPVNRRKMLRCHVIVEEPILARALGASSLEFLSACRAHAQGESGQLKEILAKPDSCVSAIPRFTFAD